MSDSVIPSLRKSESALPPELENGMTAMESICDVPDLVLARQYQTPTITIVTNKTPMVANQYLRTELAGAVTDNAAADFPDSLSRFSPCKSVRISAAGWERRVRSFSKALLMTSSRLGG